MTTAKLFILGEERELLWINTNYLRYTAANGSPTSDVEGGFLTLSFVAQENDDVFWHNMTKEVEKETDRMEKGEVHFYNKGDEDIPIRKYKFSDAYLIEYSEVFDAYETENMHIVLTISPAIQDYGAELVKYWNKSWIPPSEPVYYVPKQEKKETRVKTIELITALDFGSANDNSGTNQQEGILYGKSYEFKVVAFTEETPADKSIINWAFKYHSLSENKWIEKKLSVTGDTLKFTLNEKDMCGRFVYIRAYIKDAENEGELKVWKHNRFRWFDRKIFQKGLLERKNKPEKINQHATSLCGTASLLYFYAKDYKDEFYNLYNIFFRTGEVKINAFHLKPNELMYSFNPSSDNLKYPNYSKYSDGTPCIPRKLMNQTDWIILAGTRSSDNKKYLGENNQDWDAINWTSYMIDTATKLYGATSSIDKTRVITGLNFQNELIQIQKEYQEGWHIILLIDSDMLKDSYSLLGCITQYHWISYEGDLYLDKENHKFNFSYYCWQKLNKNATFRKSVFNSNFYGYVKFKK